MVYYYDIPAMLKKGYSVDQIIEFLKKGLNKR